MSLWFTYLLRNLTRNIPRTCITCAAVALPIVIYVLSTSVIDGVERYLDNSVKQIRLAVLHKNSIVNPLPAGYRRKIESLDPDRTRLRFVCSMQWIGGQVQDDPTPLSTLAVDPDTFLDTFPEYELTEEQRRQWASDRQAIMVGRGTADQFGWKVGDRITLKPSVPPYGDMEFHVVAHSGDAPDTVTNFCRWDYYNEKMKTLGGMDSRVGFFFVKCATQADLDHFRGAIDAQFAGTPDETKTMDEKTFMSEFINQQFNLPRNLTILSAVTVFVAIMAAANTMGMNFRDRLNEFATLKSLGFAQQFGFALIQGESLLVCLLGGVVGAALPYAVFTHTPARDWVVPVIQHLTVQLSVCGKAVLISLGIGLIAGFWPAWSAGRMHVVNALRSLE